MSDYNYFKEMKKRKKRSDVTFEDEFKDDESEEDDFDDELEIEEEHEQEYRRAWADLHETESKYLLTVELPGIKKEDIDLQLSGNTIRIKAQKKQEKKSHDEKHGSYFYAASYAGFMRTIPLPENASSENIEAEFKNGVLKIRIKKKKSSQIKKKEIRIK